MDREVWFCVIFGAVMLSNCQSFTMQVKNVTVVSSGNYTFKCPVPTTTNITVWTYIHGPTGSVKLTYQNGSCTASPTATFVSHRYTYACHSTEYHITLHNIEGNDKNILNCRDGLQPLKLGATWYISGVVDNNRAGEICNCEPPIEFTVLDTTEGDNFTLTCKVQSGILYVNWNRNIGLNTAAMGIQNDRCTTQGTTFLDNTSKYIYTCNRTVYQVTILNVQRSEHNDMYMCTTSGQQEGKGSNWIIKVKAPVTSIILTPSNYLVNVEEHTVVDITCTSSTARPAASVYWYRHPNRNWQNATQITNNITTTTDYNDLSITTSILRFVPTRQDNDTKVYCKTNNSINTSPVSSNKRLLNIVYEADDPYILQGIAYRVIENTPGTLSCTVKGENPTPTLSWSCTKFSPANQSTTNSNGNTTTTLTWNVSRAHEGTCTCTSQQTGFRNNAKYVALIVLYSPSNPVFRLNGSIADGDISFIEGTSRSIECLADSKPSPDRYSWTGPRTTDSMDIQTLHFPTIRKEDAGQYTCTVHNTMNPSNGGSVAGVNSNGVDIDVLYPPKALYFVYDYENGQNVTNKVLNVIQGDTFNIICKSIDGNPLPTIRWNRQSNNVSVLRMENIQESRTNATCTATNNMKETNRPVVHGNISDTITFTFLVHPTIKICEFFYNVNTTTNNINLRKDDIDTLMIMENESFTLKCSAEGNPTPTVWWKRPQESLVSSSLVTVNNLTREMKGDYVFTATSLLEPSFKGTYIATVSKTVSVYVLYPPAILSMNDIAKLKYEQFNLMCNYTTGMPEATSITWTRDLDDRVWDTAALNIESLENSDTGIYTCTASNIMKQSGDSKSYIGQHNQSFHLDVQYAASITSFKIDGFSSQTVTVKESDPVRFICTADSNPTAVMTVRHESKTFVTVTSNSVEYNIAKASCSDEGIFYCSARNIHHESTDILQLYVNCTNIPSPIPGPLIGGIAGSVTGCIIIVVVIIFIIRRYSLSNNSAEEQAKYNTGRLEDKTIENNDATTYDEIESVTSRNNSSAEDSAYNTVSSAHNYEMVNVNTVESTPYLPLDQTELHNVMTSDTTSENIKDEYEYMKIQVF